MPELQNEQKAGTQRQPTAVEQQQLVVQAKTKTVRDYLFSSNIQKQLQLAIPNSMTPDRLARLVLTEVRRIPELLDCTRASLIGSVIECAQLGLEPGTMGQAWIIPFKNHGVLTATLIIGYRGLLYLMYQSDRVRDATAGCVFKGDDFEWDKAADSIHHRPCGENDPDLITHAYSIIRTSNGGRIIDVMFRAEIDAIRKRARASQSGPWVTDYAEMCKKTVTRRNSKYAPASTRVQRAISLDEQAELGLDQNLGESFAEVMEDEPPTVTTATPVTTTAPTKNPENPEKPEVERQADEGRAILGMDDAEYQALKDANKGDMAAVLAEINRRVTLRDSQKK